MLWATQRPHAFLDGYCSTVQGLLDWFEVDLGFTELLFIQIGLCVMNVFVLYSRDSLSLDWKKVKGSVFVLLALFAHELHQCVMCVFVLYPRVPLSS